MSSEGRAVKQVKSAVERNHENVTEKVDTAKEKVSASISTVADKIQQGADSGKAFLNESADKVNTLAHQALDKANDIGQRAADVVENSSEYIKNFDFEETKESVKTAIKEKPEIALITVAVLGLAVGYLLGKKNV